MKQVTFLSTFQELCVPFVQSAGKDIRGYPTSGKTFIAFEDGKCVLDIDEQRDRVERLREAAGNQKNGGNSFWEVPEDVLNEASLGDGGYAVSEPDNGVTDADVAALKYLDRLPASIPPKAAAKAVDMALTIYDRFRVRGIPRPSEDDKPLLIRSKALLILDAIKSKGLYGDSSGEANTSGGAEEDKG